MEWVDSAVLLIRWVLVASLGYGAYLCLFFSSLDGPPRVRRSPALAPMRLVGASTCVMLVVLVLAWQPETTQAGTQMAAAHWPAPNPAANGDGAFQAYEYYSDAPRALAPPAPDPAAKSDGAFQPYEYH